MNGAQRNRWYAYKGPKVNRWFLSGAPQEGCIELVEKSELDHAMARIQKLQETIKLMIEQKKDGETRS